jgi:deoxyribonuclease-2
LGHTKGDLAFDNTSGFWLIHSVPKFPPNDSYHYPETGTRYGQSFLCVTFDYLTFNEIGLQLLYNGPQIYDKYLPDNLASGVPYIKKAIDGG